MEPITREEYYLAKIAGTWQGKTPEPVTIEEYYLATMAGDYSGNTPQPVTRLQYYMAKAAGVWGGSIPAPVTRLEYYWAAIASGEGKVFPPVTREEHFLVLVADAYSVVLTVVTGNPALLENSKGNRGLESLTLYGKSTQVSTTGAQLFNMSEIMAETLLGTETPIEVHAVGYWTSGYIPVKTGNYICSSKDSGRGWTYDADKNGLRYISNSGGSPIPIKEGEAFIRVTGANTADPQNFMFNEGNSIKPYEPYTGGNPSPTPQCPQEIKSVGDAGEISVEVCGKNLIAGRKFYGNYSNGIAYIIKLDGDVVFPYKPSYATYGICYAINALAGKKYTFSGYNLNDNASLRIAEYANLNDALDSANVIGYKFGGRADTFVTYTAKKNGIIICLISGIWSSNNDLIHICTESELLQIELGSKATSYEPYKPAQTLIVPTPNGLPGIPVSSGGNYTDEKGQQWVCNEIDLAKGERVQRIGEYVFTGAEVWNTWGVNQYTEGITGFYSYLKNTSYGRNEVLNTHAIFRDSVYGGRNEGTFLADISKKPYIIWSIKNEYLEDVSSNEVAIKSLKKMLGEINAKMLYCLAELIRTPLSPETIAAYKALRTYSPTTTVINDAGAGMSVGYAKMK